MRSKTRGTSAPRVEVTNISANGVWIWAGGKELFMPYDDFPWFKDAPIRSILRVEEISEGHFYWPDLDVDLSVEIIEHPEKYPLKMQ